MSLLTIKKSNLLRHSYEVIHNFMSTNMAIVPCCYFNFYLLWSFFIKSSVIEEN